VLRRLRNEEAGWDSNKPDQQPFGGRRSESREDCRSVHIVIENGDLRGENSALRQLNELLLRRAAAAEQAFATLSRGEVDAITLGSSSSTPLLLHAAQEELRSNQRLWRSIFDGALDAMLLTDDAGRCVDANPAACALYGIALEQLIGCGVELMGPELVGDAQRRTLLARGNRRGTFNLTRPDGARSVEYRSVPNVAPNLDLFVLSDVTERVEAERNEAVFRGELRASRDSLEEAQSVAHVGSWTSGVGPGEQLLWSAECYRIFGIPAGTPMTVESFFEYVSPADRERVLQASRDATERGAAYDIEHRVQRSDGVLAWVRERAVVERDALGRPIRLLGTVQDVSDRHVALEALQASELRYRRIVENTSEGVWTYDAHGVTTFMNARMSSMLGYTGASEGIGTPIPATLAAWCQLAAPQRAPPEPRGGAGRVDVALRRKDGSELWTSIQVSPIFSADGSFDGAVALVADVSGHRLADVARARLAAIVESSEDAILSATLDGTITSWNKGAETLYRYPASEMLGKSMFLLISPAHMQQDRDMLAAAARGEAVRQFETERLRRDGAVIEVALTLSPVRDVNGTVIGVSKIVRDLTARRQTEAALRRSEEQFRQAQKMEAVGRLAGGVAHDFNNLLSVVLSYSSSALESLEPSNPLHADVKEIEIAGNRATELTRQLLAFSRQQVLQPRVVDLNRTILGMKGMLARLLSEDIELSILPGTGLGSVLADQGQLEQVLMNLAVNARDAMPDGGLLTIETTNVELDPLYVGAHLGVQPGAYVKLTIGDTGAGMDACTRARIFEPFFTTKEQGKGTGLGLSTALGIIEQSGGHIDVFSEVGHGCRFEVFLPRTARIAPTRVEATSLALLHGSETILLVEDETQVRRAACAILRRRGYDILEAANGEEACQMSQTSAKSIHLLLTDVVMPRMGGRRLAEQLLLLRPEMKVLFVSGYTDDAIVRHGVLAAGIAFLQKPFTPETLARKVRDVLDAPAEKQP